MPRLPACDFEMDEGRDKEVPEEVGFNVSLVVRLEGTNVEAARAILEEAKSRLPTMQTADDLGDAARKVTAMVSAA